MRLASATRSWRCGHDCGSYRGSESRSSSWARGRVDTRGHRDRVGGQAMVRRGRPQRCEERGRPPCCRCQRPRRDGARAVAAIGASEDTAMTARSAIGPVPGVAAGVTLRTGIPCRTPRTQPTLQPPRTRADATTPLAFHSRHSPSLSHSPLGSRAHRVRAEVAYPYQAHTDERRDILFTKFLNGQKTYARAGSMSLHCCQGVTSLNGEIQHFGSSGSP